MRNISHKNNWNPAIVQVSVDPPLIPLIKGNNDNITKKDCVRIKVRRDTTSKKTALYKFKRSLFDNGDP